MLRFLRFSLKRVKSKEWLIDCKHFVDKCGSVSLDPGHVADPLCKALGRLEDRVEVVVLQELGTAVFQNLGVYAPAPELSLNCLDAPFGFIKCFCNPSLPEISIRAVFKARKR